jgi:hypothetical protein
VQAEWTNGDVPVIVATIAFGMGEGRQQPYNAGLLLGAAGCVM